MKKLLVSFVLNHTAKLILVLMVFGISNAALSQNEPKGEQKKGELAKAESKEDLLKYMETCVKEIGNPELCECMTNALETIAHPNHVTFTKDGPSFSEDIPLKVKHQLSRAIAKCQEQHVKLKK